ncbi:protein CROWDED NUCLEI 1 [Morus notabilis]|uniref:protein CROWDED NUCLEI 1 n=1 Tax=Morus notabilis TaxID=981085 RepID=UPI000CED3E84|nr:protein CROWDED NUCLEI 1 [Morus notabilis]
MFSPQRKATASALSLTPRSGVFSRNAGQDKTAAFVEGPPPPPLGSLSGAKSASLESEMGNMDDWRRFKEAGLLDEAAMVRKDHEALTEKLSNLENQLFNYQYNMGILLIEKEDWNSKFEELGQALAETHEILKREQLAHLVALSEAEKREENLRKALSAEKQCIVELEKALRETNEEQVQLKLASDSKLAEANKLIIGIGEKSAEIENKLQAAEAKLVYVCIKSTELNIRLEEVEARESVLQKEHHTLIAEREAHKATFRKQQKDLQEWEKKLHEREERLCEGRRAVKEREEKTNENERIYKQTEMELQLLEKNIELSSLDLKEKEEDISKRLEDLLSKEKETDSLRNSLEAKHKELHQLEEKLSSREKVEVQQLLDEHKAIFDVKMQELELELEGKRKSVDKELSGRVDALEKKEAEINHREEKLEKREQALHERSERLKEKNKESEEKLKAIKAREKIIKSDERKLEVEKQQIITDKESLQILLAEVEKIKAENIQLELQIREESESKRITNKERSEHVRLQLELKQEIEKYRGQSELLSIEAKELKEEKENFEQEWEDLDKKRSVISKELRELAEEKEKLEKLRHLEEHRLKEEKHAVHEFRQRELEDLKREKDSLAAKMEMEQLTLSEKAQLEHSQMIQDFELRRRNLESEIQNQREEMEKLLYERERAFEDERERELNNIKYLKGVAHKEREELKLERHRIEKQREQLTLNKEQFKQNELEMQNDIDQLATLSKKVKDQREELLKDRAQFLAFVEKVKTCRDGGEVERELSVSNFHVPEVSHGNAAPLPTLHEEHLENSPDDLAVSNLGSSKSGGRMSWLQKCTSVFKLSPNKISEHVLAPIPIELPPSSAAQVKTDEKAKEPALGSDGVRGPDISEDRPPAPLRISNDVVNVQRVQVTNIVGEIHDGYAPSVDDHSNLDSKVEAAPEDSLQSESKSALRKPSRRHKSGLHRTHSVQAAVEDAKAFLGKTLEEPGSSATIPPSDSYNINEESRDDSVHIEKGNTARKRQRSQTSHISESEQDVGDSEACSGSVTAGRRRKRQQTVASGLQTPGEERYNFRPRKNGMVKDLKKTREKEAGGSRTPCVAANPEAVSVSLTEVAQKSPETKQTVHVITTKTVEFSENKIVRFITSEDIGDSTDAAESVENTKLSMEINGTSECGDEDENNSSVHESADDDYDYEEQPGEVSIGKKIWTFFTT